MRILFVGQAPGRRARRGARALSGQVGARIAALAGVTLEQFLDRAGTVNVLKTWPGKAGKGDRFPMAAARRGAGRIERSRQFVEADKIVLVGRGPARAFGWLHKLPPCEWSSQEGWFAYLPHPSGVNHWYNEAKNRKKASSFLKELLA